MPLNFGKVMKQLDTKIKAAGSSVPYWLCLSDQTSKWNMDLYLAVNKELPGLKKILLFLIIMNNLTTFYTDSRETWRKWLVDNFDKKDEIWLIYPKKSSGKPRIPYNDAVEEALCFGWIDSIIRKLDDDHTMQRFTRRRSKSKYSQANKERLRWLVKHKMIHSCLEEEIQPILNEAFTFPKDILKEIRKDKSVWGNYEKFSPSYKRIRIAYIEAARKRPKEFNKRLINFIEKTRQNKRIPGYGGIEKYY